MVAVAIAASIVIGSVASAQGAKTSNLTIAYVTKSATNPGWLIINQGARDAAKAMGVKLIVLGPPSQSDVAGQVKIVEDLISRHVNAIALAPVNSAALAKVSHSAMKAGIPVIAVDTNIDGGVTSFVATNSYSSSADIAKWLCKRLNDKGNVIMVNGDVTQSTGADRRNGFLDYVNKNCPGVHVVQQIPTHWSSTEVLNGLQTALQAHPNVDAVYTSWGSATVAAYQALKSAGMLNSVVLTGWCSSADCSVGLMHAGKLEAAVSQFLYKEGYLGVKTAVQAAEGNTVPKRVDTGDMITTPQNSAQYLKEAHIPVKQ